MVGGVERCSGAEGGAALPSLVVMTLDSLESLDVTRNLTAGRRCRLLGSVEGIGLSKAFNCNLFVNVTSDSERWLGWCW